MYEAYCTYVDDRYFDNHDYDDDTDDDTDDDNDHKKDSYTAAGAAPDAGAAPTQTRPRQTPKYYMFRWIICCRRILWFHFQAHLGS